MELIKRQISLEPFISRRPDTTWGQITASTISLNIALIQTIEDIGIFIDEPFVDVTPTGLDAFSILSAPNLSNILSNKVSNSGALYPFMTGATSPVYSLTASTVDLRLQGRPVSTYYAPAGPVTGFTSDKLSRVRGYTLINPYQIGFDTESSSHLDTYGIATNTVSRVTGLLNPTAYTIDAKADAFIGTPLQSTGIQYSTSTQTRDYTDGANTFTIPVTNFKIQGEGWNPTNVSLDGLIKQEYLLKKVFPPEVESDVFIDRGTNNVSENHLRMSEIESLDHLLKYGNGFYNIIKQ
jgi:hypothetical protein|tara:strand:+ start:3586 stop:4470 length:885 start_codon:yes stop_codon:yes gene_type:complete